MAGWMLAVTLTCSDRECDLEVEEIVFSLDELELLVCDGCGCSLQAVAYAEAQEVRPVLRANLSLAA